MSTESAPSLQIKPTRSKYLFGFIVFIHAVALIASILNALSWVVKAVVLSGVLVSLYWYLRRYGLFAPIRGLVIRYGEGKGWTLQFDKKVPRPAKLLGSSVLTRLLCVLHFEAEKKVIPVVIPRDSLDPEDYRKLRVLLKISGGF